MTKHIRNIFLLFFTAATLAGCKKNTPKEVANEWLTDFYHLDYDAAKKLSTEETKNLLAQVQQLASMIPDSTKQALKKTSTTIKKVDINGDKATVTYIVSDNPALEQPLNLVKLNGHWLVMYTKEDQPDPSAADIIPENADTTGAAPADTTMAMDSMHH